MLYKTNIGLAKLVSSENLKSGYAFFILTWNAILGLQIFTKQCKGLKANNVEYNEVTLKSKLKYSL